MMKWIYSDGFIYYLHSIMIDKHDSIVYMVSKQLGEGVFGAARKMYFTNPTMFMSLETLKEYGNKL